MKAFPHKGGGIITDINGMDLRDYFAAKVMQGLITSIKEGKETQILLVPTTAYKIADLMMEARKI